MSSLYNRASPAQGRVLRIVEGAIKNAADAHSEIKVSPRLRRSIAKRAAGTLTAQWPDVLAATRSEWGPFLQAKPSERSWAKSLRSPRARALARFTEARAVGNRLSMSGEAGGSVVETLPLLDIAGTALRACAGPIRKAGDDELYEAIVAVLRLLGQRRKARAILSEIEGE